MKNALLSTALLLSACAPTYTGPKPAPNEIIVEAVTSMQFPGVKASPEGEAAAQSFARLTTMLVFQDFATGLPAGYERFKFPDDTKGMNSMGGPGEPIRIRTHWRSTNAASEQVIDVQWEFQPIGGKLVRVSASATASDSSVNTLQIEDALLRGFTNGKGITLIAKGR